jgi:hypothetical protein
MTTEKQTEEQKHKGSRVEVYWTTVTYRTVIMFVVVILVAALVTTYLLFPEWSGNLLKKLSEAIAGGERSGAVVAASQARFVALDGRVQVKKANSTTWSTADPSMTLDKGDLIQTGTDSNARISFTDGTIYTVRPDTLITVEENSMAQNRATKVGVSVSTGEVDLSTANWDVPGSNAQVSFADAVASFRANSRANVKTDPTGNKHELTVSAGGALVQRASGERIELNQWDRANFPKGGPTRKERVLAPPELRVPLNLAPLVVPDPRKHSIAFEWNPVEGATGYRLRISRSSMFSDVVADRRGNTNSINVSGLEAGDYFWAVTATDAQNRTSDPSQTYKFTLAAEQAAGAMLLEILSMQVHGNQVQVNGRTEPGSAILINGRSVATINPDGTFKHMTDGMSRGPQRIVITGQNRRGGTSKIERTIVIP